MKKLLLFALLVSLSVSGSTSTITFEEIIGKWKSYEPSPDTRTKIGELIAGISLHKMELEVSRNAIVNFSRQYENKRVEIIAGEKMRQLEELFVVDLPRVKGGRYKLVVSGWSEGGNKLLVGHFFLFNKKGLYNGWPVAFEPK